MSEAIKDGGPAFPQPMEYRPELGECGSYVFAGEYGEGGMSLRDYFAAAALQGMLANPTVRTQDKRPWESDEGLIAEAAYIAADALLKAREQ